MHITIKISEQKLYLYSDSHQLIKDYPVSTSCYGVGECADSNQTPRGKHIIRAKIGAGAPLKSVFVGRRPTGEIYSEELGKQFPERDWVLTRILWLSGCEKGINRLGQVDTMRRYIYIHGTADESTIGTPKSHGCIRMRNGEVVDLFDRVEVGTSVEIFN